MNFAEHTKRNWLITVFAALFFATTITMIFHDEPRNTIVLMSTFLAVAAGLFLLILVTWYFIRARREIRAHAEQSTPPAQDSV